MENSSFQNYIVFYYLTFVNLYVVSDIQATYFKGQTGFISIFIHTGSIMRQLFHRFRISAITFHQRCTFLK